MPSQRAFDHVLVTGGAGFIGSHLVPLLTGMGARVTVLDDLSSPAAPGVRPVSELPGVRLVQGSVCDARLVEQLVSECDGVVHLAAVVGVRRVLENPLRTLAVLTEGTTHVLHAATRHRRRVVYTSSSEVYGRGVALPFSESDAVLLGPPHAARWTYAVGKLHGEMLGLQLARREGLSFLAARMFNVAGPGQRADQGMVLPSLAAAAVAGRPLVVHAPGTQRRCYTHVADAAHLLLRLLVEVMEESVLVNVGSEQVASTAELAARVVAHAGTAAPVHFVDPAEVMPPGFEDIPHRAPNLAVLDRLLGAREYRSLDTIVADAVAAARQARSGTPAVAATG